MQTVLMTNITAEYTKYISYQLTPYLIVRKENIKKHSQKKWEKRETEVKEKMAEKQKKRTANIRAKQDEKIKKKVKKMTKRGRLVPGLNAPDA